MTAASVLGNLDPALKGLALGTFAIHFAAQVHVLRSSQLPSTLTSYSPNGYFVVAFCALSASLNIMWLKELFDERDDGNRDSFAMNEKAEYVSQNAHQSCQNDEESALSHVQEPQQYVNVKSTYLPFYIVGNLLLSKLYFTYNGAYSLQTITALSDLSTGEELYDLCHLFLIANWAVQFSLLYILSDDIRNSVITPANLLTHLVMKTNIGLTLLLAWRTWGILNVRAPQIQFVVCILLTFAF
jgi:hypothetical protein